MLGVHTSHSLEVESSVTSGEEILGEHTTHSALQLSVVSLPSDEKLIISTSDKTFIVTDTALYLSFTEII